MERGPLTRAQLKASVRRLCLRRVSGANTIFCHPLSFAFGLSRRLGCGFPTSDLPAKAQSLRKPSYSQHTPANVRVQGTKRPRERGLYYEDWRCVDRVAWRLVGPSAPVTSDLWRVARGGKEGRNHKKTLRTEGSWALLHQLVTRHSQHVTRHTSLSPSALLARRSGRRFSVVTAVEIIAEIEHLPADEQAKVVAFAQHLGERSMLSGANLSKLAGRLADGPPPAEAARLREEIEKGFYGASSHA